MEDGDFVWDMTKPFETGTTTASAFEMARDAFKDPFTIEWIDRAQDPDEERYSMIAIVESRLLFVAYTLREEQIRIISARGAEPYERRKYHEENRQA